MITKGNYMRLLIFLFVFLYSTTALAELKGTPFKPANDQRFDALEAVERDGVGRAKHVARITFDAAVTGGFGRSTGLFLPAGTIITDSYGQVVTAFTNSATGGTLSLQCEDSDNLLVATDMTLFLAGRILQGEQAGSVPNITNAIAARCELQFAQTGMIWSAGKLIHFIEYVVSE